jgi:hypothetical protein
MLGLLEGSVAANRLPQILAFAARLPQAFAAPEGQGDKGDN